MKTIRIMELALENFKHHKSLKLQFNGGDASIYGRNATGKTSIYDGLTWLLFGKDSRGNSDARAGVKPVDQEGKVIDHDSVTAVEAVLQVDGQTVTLRRTYKEVWSTKRGAEEATYNGNTSEYFVDGVPCKKNAFQKKIDEIVSEELFRLLTSVRYFANDLPWVKRKDILYGIAGVKDDRQIMETDSRFLPLLESLGNRTTEELKKKLLADKRGLQVTKDETPARISECQKAVAELQAVDFGKLREEIAALQSRKDSLSEQALNASRSTALDEKELELKRVQMALEQLERENKSFRDRQKLGKPDSLEVKSSLRWAENRLSGERNRGKALEAQAAEMEQELEGCRRRWMEENNRQLRVDGICPACGQNLPAQTVNAAMERAEAQRQETLRRIELEADRKKRSIEAVQKDMENSAQYIREMEAEIMALQEKVKAAESVVIADMEGYSEKHAAIEAQLQQAQDRVFELSRDKTAHLNNCKMQLREVDRELSEKQRQLSKESVLQWTKERIEELRRGAQEGARQMQEVEKMLYLLDAYSLYKSSFLVDSFNGLFRLAKFTLTRELNSGGVEDCCDVMYNGVPYTTLNDGMKVNVGIDIINTLSGVYGVQVPLFVDNAESVTGLERSDSQIIRLAVSEKDKELRIEYGEN